MEVVGIPSSLEYDLLEPTVYRILHHTGVNVSGNKIEACYQLGKNSRVNISMAVCVFTMEDSGMKPRKCGTRKKRFLILLLTLWCRNFVESQSFQIDLGDLCKTETVPCHKFPHQ